MTEKELSKKYKDCLTFYFYNAFWKYQKTGWYRSRKKNSFIDNNSFEKNRVWFFIFHHRVKCNQTCENIHVIEKHVTY